MWKRGNKLQFWSKRWYLLSGNCIYYYAHQRDIRPRGVIFVSGCIVEKVLPHQSLIILTPRQIKYEPNQTKGYYGLEILHQDLCTGDHYKHETRTLYCKTEAERDSWLTTLQHAAQVIPIEEDYLIGGELGTGRFSVVCDCVHKVTQVKYAVKIIEKAAIEAEDKALLRTEIAGLSAPPPLFFTSYPLQYSSS